jgi:hypothetical protein
MRRVRSRSCARAAIGHAAEPPSSVMTSRRRIAFAMLETTPCLVSTQAMKARNRD